MSEVDKTIEARRQRLDSLSVNFHDNLKSGFNRGSVQNMYINEFAKFYNYPVLSFGDVAFPSFVRHFTSSGVPYSIDPWSLSTDGSHLTVRGCHFVVDKIFRSFLQKVHEHHHAMSDQKMSSMLENMNITYGFDLHMFQPDVVKKIIDVIKFTASPASSGGETASSTTDSSSNNTHTLQSIAKVNKDFAFTSTLRFTDGLTCYDSTKRNGNALFEFTLPSTCTVPAAPCSVYLTSYHSTPDTQIGSQIDLEGDIKLSNDHGAVPIETEIIKEVGAGKYMVRCVNLEADKHTCISAVTVRQLVTVV
eukprot:gene24321-30643_t